VILRLFNDDSGESFYMMQHTLYNPKIILREVKLYVQSTNSFQIRTCYMVTNHQVEVFCMYAPHH